MISQQEFTTALRKFKNLIGLLATLLLATAFIAEAQQRPALPLIGVLGAGPGHHWDALRQQLRELGNVEGQNIIIEYRWAQGKNELLAEHAAELVRMGAKVIVTEGTPAARAAKTTTAAIPIVMAIVGDPVGSGLVANLAQPGGNVTGLTSIAPDLVTKQVELLKESVTRLTRVTALWNPDNPLTGRLILDQIEIAANGLRMQLQLLEAKGEQRLPTIYGRSDFVDAGGLASYGTSFPDLYRRAAIYVDKILRGAKPADLPVEQPTKFEFAINLKTAKRIGIMIPQSVLYRADKVIK